MGVVKNKVESKHPYKSFDRAKEEARVLSKSTDVAYVLDDTTRENPSSCYFASSKRLNPVRYPEVFMFRRGFAVID